MTSPTPEAMKATAVALANAEAEYRKARRSRSAGVDKTLEPSLNWFQAQHIALAIDKAVERERERAARIADNPPPPIGRGFPCISTGRSIASAIRSRKPQEDDR